MYVTCPDCRTRLSLDDEHAGESVTCASCDAVFRAPELPTRRPAPRGDDWEYDDEDEYDRPRRRKRAPSNGSRTALVVGALLALCTVGAVAGFLLYRSRTADRAPAVDSEARAQLTDTNRHFEPAGGFSYVPPPGWTLGPVPQSRYKMAAAPGGFGFRPNINVVEERWGGSLREYTDANLRTLQLALPGKHRFLSRDGFTTESGLTGERVVTENQFNGVWMRQTFYFFPNGSVMLVVTCSAELGAAGEALDPVFRASMRTFRLGR